MTKNEQNCIFCKIIKGEIKQKIEMQTDNFVVILDAHPAADGHSLVIPKKHYVTLLDIPNNIGGEIIQLTKKVASSLMDDGLADGFNLIMNNLVVAGQVVMHAHIHVIPRKEKDGLDIRVKRQN